MLNINTGNQCDYLTSTASKSRGLHEYIVKHGGKKHPNSNVKFQLGDVVTTVIKTKNKEHSYELLKKINFPFLESKGN